MVSERVVAVEGVEMNWSHITNVHTKLIKKKKNQSMHGWPKTTDPPV